MLYPSLVRGFEGYLEKEDPHITPGKIGIICSASHSSIFFIFWMSPFRPNRRKEVEIGDPKVIETDE